MRIGIMTQTRKFRIATFLMIVIIFGIFLVRTPVSAKTTKIKLNKKAITLEQECGYTLVLEGVSKKAKVKWSVSDKSVVTLENKKNAKCDINAIAPGEATVKAKYKGYYYKCKVTVTVPRQEEESQYTKVCTFEMYNIFSNETFTSVVEYTGEAINDIPNGEGVIKTHNSDGEEYTVTGTFSNGKLDGVMIFELYDEYGNIKATREDYYENCEFKKSLHKDDSGTYEFVRYDDVIYEFFSPTGADITITYHAGFADGSEYVIKYEMFNTPYCLKNNYWTFDDIRHANKTKELPASSIKAKASYIEPRYFLKNPDSYKEHSCNS